MHYYLQGTHCHRLTEKGGGRSVALILASPLHFVGSTKLADNNWYIHKSFADLRCLNESRIRDTRNTLLFTALQR